MKAGNKLKWFVSILGLVTVAVWLTGCGGSSNNNNNNGAGGTNAPASVAGRTINHTVTTGTAPMATTGSFSLAAQGNDGDTTGNYTSTGGGGIPDSTGTYTYTMTAANTATLVLQDSNLGEVTETLTFQTPTSGTFQSVNTGTAGTQSGTFNLQ